MKIRKLPIRTTKGNPTAFQDGFSCHNKIGPRTRRIKGTQFLNRSPNELENPALFPFTKELGYYIRYHEIGWRARKCASNPSVDNRTNSKNVAKKMIIKLRRRHPILQQPRKAPHKGTNWAQERLESGPRTKARSPRRTTESRCTNEISTKRTITIHPGPGDNRRKQETHRVPDDGGRRRLPCRLKGERRGGKRRGVEGGRRRKPWCRRR